MPIWLKNAVFYEIYPQSFLDTNGDGIGDFRGIINKLDYIKELGCNAIWMNPCFDSPFLDAGYDVRNYFKTASRYGTNEELKELFEELREALDSLDMDGMESVMKKMDLYQYPEEQEDLYEQLKSAVEQIDSEASEDILQLWESKL